MAPGMQNVKDSFMLKLKTNHHGIDSYSILQRKRAESKFYNYVQKKNYAKETLIHFSSKKIANG